MAKKKNNAQETVETVENNDIETTETLETSDSIDSISKDDNAQETVETKLTNIDIERKKANFIFHYIDKVNFKSTVFLNKKEYEINCVDGIIKTDESILAEFLTTHHNFKQMGDK